MTGSGIMQRAQGIYMLTGLRSRKHIVPFELVQPRSVEDCCAQLALPGRSAFMAGGLDLIDRMKTGETFSRVVSLSRVAGLSDIRLDEDTIVIGAAATHAKIAQSPVVAEWLPDLARFWAQIANPRVRFAGTIGGNLISAQPHYDAMPALLALDAMATVADASGLRQVSIAELADCKAMLVDIRVRTAGWRLIADRSLHPALAVYVGACAEGEDILQLRIAIGGACARPIVFTPPTQDIVLSALGDVAGTLARDIVTSLPDIQSDGLASASYRRRMTEVLSRRLLVRLGNRA